MSRPQVVIHAGFAHSGTTSLQENFLSRRAEILYCGIPYGPLGGIFSFIKYQDATTYDESYVRQLCDALIWDARQDRSHVVLSDETFVEQPEVYYTPAMQPVEVIARRLQALFAPCRIVFTIRSQPKYVSSSYFNLKRNYALQDRMPIDAFDRWFEGNQTQVANLFLRNLDYARAIRTYMQVFGDAAVTVLPLEILEREGAPAYLDRVGEGFGLPIGGSDGEAYATIRNRRLTAAESDLLTQWCDGRLREPDRTFEQMLEAGGGAGTVRTGPPASAVLSQPQLAFLGEKAGPGNRFIADHFGLPLERYGYPMGNR